MIAVHVHDLFKFQSHFTLLEPPSRDDQYIRSMLRFISVLFTERVKRSIPPEACMYHGMEGYQTFLEHTVILARGAKEVVALPGGIVPMAQGSDVNAFWQGSTQ